MNRHIPFLLPSLFLLLSLLLFLPVRSASASDAEPGPGLDLVEPEDAGMDLEAGPDGTVPAPPARAFLPRRLPAGAGWILILVACVPLFWGWKIIRVTMAVFFALAAALVAYELAAPRAGLGWGAAAAGLGMVVGACVGWHIRKLFAALEVAAVLGFLFALPGLYFEHELTTFGLGLAGFVLGLVLGWRVAFYLDAIDSSLAGGFLAGIGAMTVAQDLGRDASLLIGIGVLAVSALLGVAVQFRSVKKSKGRET